MRKRGWWRGVLVCVGMLAGCGTTVAGVAVKAPQGTGSTDVNAPLLNTGQYPTHADHPFPIAGTASAGAYLEGVRLAEFVVGPWEVDPTLRRAVAGNIMAIADAQGLKNDIGDAALDVAAGHGFIAGFSTARNVHGPGPDKSLANLVMRFPDPDAARTAATEMGAKVLQAVDLPQRLASIPRHPEAAASTFDILGGGVAVWSFAAHGPYVLWQEARTKDLPEVAGQLIANTLEQQAPRIDGFAPTDPAKLADLPIDPTGQLLARTLPPPPSDNPSPDSGVYQPRGDLHFEFNPAMAAALFTDAGVEVVTQRWTTTVYQTHDAAGATRIVDRLMADTPATPIAGVPGLPVAKCFDQGTDAFDARFVCVACADRYAFVALAGQELDAKQKTAAQYRILAGK